MFSVIAKYSYFSLPVYNLVTILNERKFEFEKRKALKYTKLRAYAQII